VAHLTKPEKIDPCGFGKFVAKVNSLFGILLDTKFSAVAQELRQREGLDDTWPLHFPCKKHQWRPDNCKRTPYAVLWQAKKLAMLRSSSKFGKNEPHTMTKTQQHLPRSECKLPQVPIRTGIVLSWPQIFLPGQLLFWHGQSHWSARGISNSGSFYGWKSEASIDLDAWDWVGSKGLENWSRLYQHHPLRKPICFKKLGVSKGRACIVLTPICCSEWGLVSLWPPDWNWG